MALIGRRKPGFTVTEMTTDPASDTIREERKGEKPLTAEEPLCTSLEEETPTCEGEMLAGFIRMQSRARQPVSLKQLEKEEARVSAMLEEMYSLPSCSDITEIRGALGAYLYSSKEMSGFYAMLAVLALEHIPERTISELVRYNCRVYPSATPEGYFELKPFSMTRQEIESALDGMSRMKEYEDIRRVRSLNGVAYLYSAQYFDDAYGKAMADYAEEDDG